MIQVAVLVAGVVGNIAFAWMLISFGNMFGMPTSLTEENKTYLRDPKVLITAIAPSSPASVAGIKPGDAIKEVHSGTDVLAETSVTPESVQDFISSHGTEKLTLVLGRGKSVTTIDAYPVDGIVEGRVALGISMDHVGLLSLPIHKAIYQGALSTGNLVSSTATGLYTFVTQAFLGKAKFSDVSGPVGIAGMVGEARTLGFSYLIYFTALISINLAVINLVPFPALDGGRILFVAIEAVRRKAIPPHVANMLNGIGFVLLITLMVIVTYKDIVKLF
jgi:regulator of sigma E protease